MPDVRRLVGIDAGVLDQNFAADVGSAFTGVAGHFGRLAARQSARSHVPLQARIDITRARDFQLLESLGQRQRGHNLLGNLARRFAQALRQFKRERQGELAHLHLGWLLDDDVGQFDLVSLAQKCEYMAGQLFLLF